MNKRASLIESTRIKASSAACTCSAAPDPSSPGGVECGGGWCVVCGGGGVSLSDLFKSVKSSFWFLDLNHRERERERE